MLDLLFSCFKRQTKRQHTENSQSTDRSTAEDVCESRVGFQFSLQDLKIATHNFHPENILGEGGFGCVYKGVLKNGTEVAVKKLSAVSGQGKAEFLNEVQLLTSVQHRNLVRLFGCCAEGSERLLVYEFLKNKSLHQALFDPQSELSSSLEWSVRRMIIMRAAKGFSYLHGDSRVRIIHRDIKASNILLDDKVQPKIADFGLAKLFSLDQTHASTRVAGTFGYLAPEYAMNGKLTEKADVYSFGVVMLEVVSGRKNTNIHLPWHNQRLVEVAWRLYKKQKPLELVDCRLGNRYVPEEVVRVVHVALLCTQAAADLRPSMSKVVALLHGRSPIPEKPTKPPLIVRDSPRRRKKHKANEVASSIGTSGSSGKESISSIF